MLPPLAVQVFKSLKCKEAAVGTVVKTLCQLLKKQRSKAETTTNEPIQQHKSCADPSEEPDVLGDNKHDGEGDRIMSLTQIFLDLESILDGTHSSEKCVGIFREFI